VVGWFGATRDAIADQYDRQIPSLAFVHIPIQASIGLQELRRESKSHAYVESVTIQSPSRTTRVSETLS
jgi:hypothetical protein